MSDSADKRPDARKRPPDPAGTQPKVDPESLLPTTLEPLLGEPNADVVEGTAEEEPFDDARTPAVPAAPMADASSQAHGVTGEADAFAPIAPVPAAASGDLLPERRAAMGLGSPVAAQTPQAPRFQFLLGMLIAFGVAAAAATAALVTNEHTATTLRWSAWHPTAKGYGGAQQIANYVAPNYRLPSGHQLVSVKAGPLRVAGMQAIVALRSDPTNANNVFFVPGNAVAFQLCGSGPKCAIGEGKPTTARGLLLSREALELALYTFRYVNNADQVVVFIPPRPGKAPSHAQFFRPNDLAAELNHPLTQTLTPQAPSVSSVRSWPDASLVSRVTTPTLYDYTFKQTSDLNVFLVLAPVSPLG